jgi:chorismate-pyruvate lyase
MFDPEDLVRLFHANTAELAVFQPIETAGMPAAARELLDHHEHMTVTVERFHGSPVDVDVRAERANDGHYAREIVLRRQSDRAVVQYGIMRIDLDCVSGDVRREIEARREPLGRILIRHDVLRQVERLALLRVIAGPVLQNMFTVQPPRPTYGRTALIHFQDRPAVELLEIITPV